MICTAAHWCQTKWGFSFDTAEARRVRRSGSEGRRPVFHSPGPIAVSFTVPPELPLVGGLHLAIRWYGVLIASAMALGLWLAAREATRRGERPDELLKASEFALVGALVGARLYYVLFNLDYYQSQPWWRTLAVWE